MITTSRETRLQLGQQLLNAGIVKPEQLEQALHIQESDGNKLLLGEVLVQQGFCTEEQIMESLARGYGLPFARINPHIADPRVVDVLPREFLEKHHVLPLFKVHGKLTIAVSEPANVFLLEEIGRITECELLVVCATAREIQNTLQTHLPQANVFVIDDIVGEIDSASLAVVEDHNLDDIADLESAAGDSPVIRMVNHLIYHAVHEGASDIHIEPDDNALRIRFLVHVDPRRKRAEMPLLRPLRRVKPAPGLGDEKRP